MSAHLEFQSWVPFPIEQVFLFFANPENLPRIMPEKSDTRIAALRLVAPPAGPGSASSEDLRKFAGVGSEILTSFRLVPPFAFRAQWLARITAFEWNQFFEDVQVRGLFKSWRHRHELSSETREGVQGTNVRDKVDYEFGLGPLDALLEPMISLQMKRMFVERQKILPRLLQG
jgi:ligand-binding SRPBCC domain-containing protein